MGKNLIQQARGTGSPTYRAPSHRFKGRISHASLASARMEGIVREILHCPGHSAPLIRIEYDNGEEILAAAPEKVCVGQIVSYAAADDLSPGSVMNLRDIPEGTAIFNLESNPGDGGKFARSSGVFAKITAIYPDRIMVLLPSKKERAFNPECRAMIGTVAGGGRTELPFIKAGKRYHRMRARNKLYPQSSGVAMNAVDHPFGGSRTSKKGRPTTAPKNAPPGRKVGMLHARRTGRKRGEIKLN